VAFADGKETSLLPTPAPLLRQPPLRANTASSDSGRPPAKIRPSPDPRHYSIVHSFKTPPERKIEDTRYKIQDTRYPTAERLDQLLFRDAPNYDRIVGNGFIRSAENAKHFRISRREIRNDCLAAMRFCSKIAGMHKCIPYA
jgi:hypothetical protein